MTFIFNYSYEWDGQIRYPESILTRDNSAKAFFLTGLIIDSFEEKDDTLSLHRYWEVLPQGNIALSINLDYSGPEIARFYIPPVIQDSSKYKKKFSFLTQRLSYCGGLFAFCEDEPFFIQAKTSQLTDSGMSLGITAPSYTHCSSFKLQYRYPAKENIPLDLINQGYHQLRSQEYYQSPGNFKTTQELILRKNNSTQLFSYAYYINKKDVYQKSVDDEWIEQQRTQLFSDYYYEKGCVAGFREAEKTNNLSSFSSLLFALITIKNNTDDEEKIEKALRMADFVLTGQNPKGFFYTHFNPKKGWYQKEKFSKENTFSILDSSYIANYFLELAILLKNKGMSHSRYLNAAEWFILQFFDSAKNLKPVGTLLSIEDSTPLSADRKILILLKPLFLLWNYTNNAIYKNAFLSLYNNQFPNAPEPGTILSFSNNNDADYHSHLFFCDLLITVSEMELDIQNLDAYALNIIPWLYTQNKSMGLTINPYLSSIESYARQVSHFVYAKTAYILKSLAKNLKPTLKATFTDISQNLFLLRKNLSLNLGHMNYSYWKNGKTNQSFIGQITNADSQQKCEELYFSILYTEKK